MLSNILYPILVLGDFMLDVYTRGRVERLSPEAPVPVLCSEGEETRLGGAGAVAALLVSLGCRPLPAGVVGDDPAGEAVTTLLGSLGDDSAGNALCGVPGGIALSGVPALLEDGLPSPSRNECNGLEEPCSNKQRGEREVAVRTTFATPQRAFPTEQMPLSPCRAASCRRGGGNGVPMPPALVIDSRPTTVKQRFLGQSCGRPGQQLLRVDREVCRPLAGQVEDELLAAALAALEDAAAVLISDYGKGVCTPRIVGQVIAAARQRRLPVLVDPRRGADYGLYRWANLIKPNRHEAGEATGRTIRSRAEAFAAGKQLCARWGFQAAVITLDADGLALVTAAGERHFATQPRDVADVTGAGDTVLAVLGAALARGIGLDDACRLAVAAAGLQVERSGVSPVSWSEVSGSPKSKVQSPKSLKPADIPVVEEGIGRQGEKEITVTTPRAPSPCQPISLTALINQLALHRANGRRITFTNGCFDLIHAGHLHCLMAAKALGDVLVVAINSDAGVRRLKGAPRPIVGQRDRAALLAALSCVDYVTIFDDDTPERLIAKIRPDVLVKGDETRPDGIAGEDFVRSYGGRVEIVPFLRGHSTTKLVEKVRRKSPKSKVQSRREQGTGHRAQQSESTFPSPLTPNPLPLTATPYSLSLKP